MTMTAAEQVEKAARAITRGLRSGIPFLQFGDGDEALRLCYRRAGEEIDDPACYEVWQAIEAGVFKRCVKMRGEEKSFIYLRICNLDQDEIGTFFRTSFDNMSYVDIESLPMDAAFQVMQFEEATARAAARSNRMNVC